MSPLFAALLPSLLVAALTLYVNRIQRTRDVLAATYLERLQKLEEGKHRHATEITQITVTAAVLQARVEGLHQSDGDLRGEIADIRENMVRRADLEPLGQRIEDLSQRIDDVLRRGSSGNHPAPRRR